MGHARHIFMSQYGINSWQSESLAFVYTHNIGMRVRRVQNARIQHIWLLKLSRVDRRTCDKWTCVYPALLLSHHMGAS